MSKKIAVVLELDEETSVMDFALLRSALKEKHPCVKRVTFEWRGKGSPPRSITWLNDKESGDGG